MSDLLKRRPFWELVFSLALMLAMVVVLIEAGKVKTSPFDELGSAFFPRALAIIIVVLSIPVFIRNAISILRPPAAQETGVDSSTPALSASNVIKTITISFLTIAYVGGIALRLLPFSVLTAAFLTFGILALNGWKLHRIIWIIPGAIIFGLLMEYMFTRVFIMDLPAFQVWF